MFNRDLRAIALAVCLAARTGSAGADADAAGVSVSAAAQSHLGVATARLARAHHAAEIDAFAKVLDPAPLAQLDSDLRTALAAAEASKAQADRSRALAKAGGAMAAKDVEAAVAQARSDALKVQLLRRQLGLTWGPGIARLNAAERERLVEGLSRGSIALAHVDTHNNEGQDGARQVRVDIGAGSVTGRVIGPARAAEPRLQSSGLIVEITGPSALLLSVGLTQSAHIATTSTQAGVVIPRGAVIRFEGSQWVYVQTGPTHFERRLLQDPVVASDGLFVAQGFTGGEAVVSRGAMGLFAAERSRAMKAR